MKDDKKKKLTAKQAESLLPKGKNIHTFRNGAGLLIGCDWSRKSILDAITKHKKTLELTGSTARSMGHGIVLQDSSGYLFIETDEAKMDKFDPA